VQLAVGWPLIKIAKTGYGDQSALVIVVVAIFLLALILKRTKSWSLAPTLSRPMFAAIRGMYQHGR